MNLSVVFRSTKQFFNWLFNSEHKKMFTLPTDHSSEDGAFKKRVLKNVQGDIWISQGNILTSEQHKEYIQNAFRN